jgi:hypothetical protein
VTAAGAIPRIRQYVVVVVFDIDIDIVIESR